MKKRILSAIQPTGQMHFGNYFGAVKNWVDLQEKYECVYGIVDYHAMTMPYKPDKLRQNTWEMAFDLLAVGVRTENLFIQSLIPEHAELSWILSCFTSFGEMTRMTQFKDKSQKVKDSSKDAFISGGLFFYPVLQAADILIYHADYVPVGRDQKQHLELTRNIADRFNSQFKKEYFSLPEILFTETPKIASPADPTRKMSKSAGAKHYINLFEDENRIRKQIKSAVTDIGTEESGEMSPGIANLFSLLKACERIDEYNTLSKDYKSGSLKYVDLKQSVADALVDLSNGFKERKAEITADKKAVKQKIKASSYEIRKIAQQTLKEVKEITGILNVRF